MKFKLKLLTGFAFLILLLLIVGLINVTFFAEINSRLDELTGKLMQTERTVQKARVVINHIHSEILNSIIIEKKDRFTNLKSLDSNAIKFYSIIDKLSELHPENENTFEKLRQTFQVFYIHSKWMLKLPGPESITGNPEITDKFNRQKNTLIDTLDLSFKKYEGRFQRSGLRVKKTAFILSVLSFVVVGLGLVFSIMISVVISNTLTRPISKLMVLIREIKMGNFRAKADFGSGDEISELASEFNDMAERLHENFSILSDEISIRKEKEEETRHLRKLLKNIIDSMPSSLVGIDRDGNITHMNLEAEKATGITQDQAYGKKFTKVFPCLEGEKNMVTESLETGKALKSPRVHLSFADKTMVSDITVYPLFANGIDGVVIRIDDITERIQIEEVIIQTEKMMSVGGLAAGMAHEINNPLAGIIQSMQVIRNRITSSFPKNREIATKHGTDIEVIESYLNDRGVPDMIRSVIDSGTRAANIVNNMLSFSRRSNSKFIKHNLIVLMDKTLELLESEYNLKKKYDFRKINIIKEYSFDMPDIPCEKTQIQQVFLNLLKNGAQAMADTEDTEKRPCFVIRLRQIEDFARVEIEDNGPGMDDSTRKRVFEPFYTTKETGEGTGLGLSVSYFIITENHSGTMMVESTPGRGTKFIIELPIRMT